MKKALITGITGQDGYYLSKLLLSKGYEVHGTIRRSSNLNTKRIDPLISEYSGSGMLTLHYSDLLDSASLSNIINTVRPNEVYNLGAQSHVAVSFKNPVFTSQVGTLGSISLLEALRTLDYETKFQESVIRDFADSYVAGETPIPCVRCNQTVKFRDLLSTARELGADALATGHYIRRVGGPNGAELYQGSDKSRDQSYFHCRPTQ